MEETRILVVDDEQEIADLLELYLISDGYQVIKSEDALEGLAIMEREKIDLVLLDIMMPKMDGLEMCRKIREKHNVPIIMVSAKTQELDKIVGLTTGADDYVTKPFRMQELLVRIQALLRRTARSGHEKRITGELEFDINRCHIFKNKKSVELSTTEWRIAAVLIEHYPAAVSREELLYQVWDKDAMYVEENTLNVNISRVREKLGRYDGQQYIETVRGIGYRWSVDVK